ncbi:MAG: hypothetical protein ACRCY3_09610, partial [Sphingorhabdus sp.]
MSDHFTNRPHASAAIIASSAPRLQELERLAAECGCFLRKYGEDCDFLLISRNSVSESNGQDWSEIADYLESHDSEAVIWSGLDAIDAAYAALPAERCHFLVDAADWQAVAILSGVGRKIRGY